MGKFTLRDGDTVRFLTITGRTKVGTLIRRPYGRRIHAVVKDEGGQLNYLPTRDFIIEKMEA